MIKAYIQQLFHFASKKVLLSIILYFFSGLTQGIGLLMIIPLLYTSGLLIGTHNNTTSQIARYIESGFSHLGLPLNLFSVLVVYVVIVSLFAFLRRVQTVLNMTLQQGFILHLRHRLYTALTYANWSFILKRKSSDITHAITSDIQRVGQGTQHFLKFASEITVVLFQLGVAFLLSVPLTAATLVFGVFIMMLMQPLNRKAETTGEFFRQSRKKLFGAVIQQLVGMKTAKSYGVEESHLTMIKDIDKETEAQKLSFIRVQAKTRMVYEIASVVVLAIFFVVALNIKSLHIPVSELFVLVFVFSRLMPRFSSLMQSMQKIKNMMPSFNATSKLFEQAIEVQEFSPGIYADEMEINRCISFHGVSFRYSRNSKWEVLKDVGFDIPVRQITAITGPSGAGKSTLADLLLGLLKPDKGYLSVDGKIIGQNDLISWRHMWGYVPQETFLFHDTIRANLQWAMPLASEDDMWQALELAAAHDFIKNLPHGLDMMIGDRGITLSGGERQRLALARALLRKPKLLLLDEATSALDPANEQLVFQALENLKEKMTIVIIAHRQTTLQFANHIIILENGQVKL